MIFDCDKAVELAVKIDGWMDRDELAWLFRRARRLPSPGGVWVEVGCWKGRSFIATALGLPPKTTIHAVDNWRGDLSSAGHWEAREIPGWIRGHFDLVPQAIRTICGDYAPMIVVHDVESCNSDFVENRSVDAAFIDASHDYNSVANDILAWRPKIKLGGILCGHDYAYHEVAKAVAELLPDFKLGPKTIWYAEIR